MKNKKLNAADANLTTLDENQHDSFEPVYYDPLFLESQAYVTKNPTQGCVEVSEGRSDADTIVENYQSLNIATQDYVSLYSGPEKRKNRVIVPETKVKGGIVPEIEVEGSTYAVLNGDKTEQNIYTSLDK